MCRPPGQLLLCTAQLPAWGAAARLWLAVRSALSLSMPCSPILVPLASHALRRLGDVVSLVCDMAEGGLRPDSFTFAAIFNACQRTDEAELALDVARSAQPFLLPPRWPLFSVFD